MGSLSVIIPCYNSESTIERAILSVLNQSYPIYEIICIDDKSSDNTVSIIQNIKSEKIKIILKDRNSGPSSSRNEGIKSSSGDYIAFLDSDDYWLSSKTQICIELLKKHQLDVISTSFSLHDYQIENFTSDNELYKVKKLKLNDLLLSNSIYTSSVIMKRNNLLFDENIHYSEDYDLWLRLAKNNQQIGVLSQPLYIRNQAAYGHSGLSGRLLEMEKGELKVIIKNTDGMHIVRTVYVIISIMKFLRRLAFVSLSKI